MKEMTFISIILMLCLTKSSSPVSMAMSILAMSIASSAIIFKSTLTSWIPFVTILTFSSGMMTLFLYTASLSSNEKNKTKKNKIFVIMILMIPMGIVSNQEMKNSMKTFSSKTMLILLMFTILASMMAISSQGHHPNQTLNTSF